MFEEIRICCMYAVGDIQSDMSLVGYGGGEEDMWHAHSGGRSVRYVPTV